MKPFTIHRLFCTVLVSLMVMMCLEHARAGGIDPASTWPTPRVARVIHEAAIFRVGPGEDFDRRTPLSKGALLSVRGQTGTWLVADLGGGDRGWVEQKDVEWVEGAAPANQLRNVLIRPGNGETYVDLQMSSRTSFDVVEGVSPPSLIVRLHRSTLVMHEIAQYAGDPVLGDATVAQPQANVVELRLPLAGRASWGWRAVYGASVNLPADPPGHDFSKVTPETLRLAVKWPPARSGHLTGVTVVVDAGHGGPDLGAVGLAGLQEKSVNLDVSLALRQSLERRGARVVMTRDSDRAVSPSVDLELPARVDVAEASRGTFFISIHHNARPRVEDGRVSHGVFVYYYHPQSAELARALMDPVADAQGERVRAFVFRSFHVTRQPYMPAVLIEVGFISNPDEERKMRVSGYAQRVADGVADGVERCLDKALKP